MGVAILIGRFMLIVLNTVFLIAGLTLVMAGVVIRYLGDQIVTYIQPAINQINAFKSISGYEAEYNPSVGSFNIEAMLMENSTPFIAVGTVLGFVALFGCIGACWGLRILLLIYGILCAILVFAQILVIGVVAGMYDTFRDKAVKYIQETSDKEYQGTNATNAFSFLVNCVQMNLECCGITKYTDWQTSTAWKRDKTFYPFELDIKTTGMPTPYEIPVACCKMQEPYPSFTPKDINCAKTPTTTNSWKDLACFTKVEQYIKKYEIYMGLGAAGLILIQVLIIVAAILIWKKLGKEDKVQDG